MSVGLGVLWAGASALIVVGIVRWRFGFVAIPGFGRQPFVVVLLACWAVAAIGVLRRRRDRPDGCRSALTRDHASDGANDR